MRFGSFIGREARPSAAELSALATRLKAKLGDVRFMGVRKDVEAKELFAALAQDGPLPAFANTPETFERWGSKALSDNP